MISKCFVSLLALVATVSAQPPADIQFIHPQAGEVLAAYTAHYAQWKIQDGVQVPQFAEGLYIRAQKEHEHNHQRPLLDHWRPLVHNFSLLDGRVAFEPTLTDPIPGSESEFELLLNVSDKRHYISPTFKVRFVLG